MTAEDKIIIWKRYLHSKILLAKEVIVFYKDCPMNGVIYALIDKLSVNTKMAGKIRALWISIFIPRIQLTVISNAHYYYGNVFANIEWLCGCSHKLEVKKITSTFLEPHRGKVKILGHHNNHHLGSLMSQ